MAVTTANDIVVGAFRLVAAYGVDDVLPGKQIALGITILNEILSEFSSTSKMIPYRERYSFPMTIGKNEYTFSDLPGFDFVKNRIALLETANIEFDNVIYPCDVVPYTNITALPRVKYLNAIPRLCYLQNYPEYSSIFFYPAPSDSNLYVATIYAKFQLSYVEPFTELEQVPAYYRRFLKYAVAREISASNASYQWTPERHEEPYQRMYKDIEEGSDLNIDIKGDSLLKNYFGTYGGALGLYPLKTP